MRRQQVTHVGFSDESYWNVGRFRSLGLVTLHVRHLEAFNDEIRKLLDESGVHEFKWKKLNGAKDRFAAQKLCTFAIEKAIARQLRVDVLVWDTEDRRHKIVGRDDKANLGRMYYHLFQNVLAKRWPDGAVWRLHLDENTALDWGTIQDCLIAKSMEIKVDYSVFAGNDLRIRLYREFGIAEIQPVPSEQYPLLQLADLFAGLAVFSRDRYENYRQWLVSQSSQQPLPEIGCQAAGQSRSEIERFQVLRMFDDECKRCKLQVSLKSQRGLWTPNPRKPINFWMYKPQHPDDKAPVRKRDDLRPA